MYNICNFLYVYTISLQSKHIKIKKNKKNKKTKTKTKAKTKFKKLAYLKKKTQQLNKPKTLFMGYWLFIFSCGWFSIIFFYFILIYKELTP